MKNCGREGSVKPSHVLSVRHLHEIIFPASKVSLIMHGRLLAEAAVSGADECADAEQLYVALPHRRRYAEARCAVGIPAGPQRNASKGIPDRFCGYLPADDCAGYHTLPEEATAVGYRARARRKIDKAVKSLPAYAALQNQLDRRN